MFEISATGESVSTLCVVSERAGMACEYVERLARDSASRRVLMPAGAEESHLQPCPQGRPQSKPTSQPAGIGCSLRIKLLSTATVTARAHHSATPTLPALRKGPSSPTLRFYILSSLLLPAHSSLAPSHAQAKD